MNKGKIGGYVMAGVGSAMILANALDYVLGWKTIHSAIGTIGLVFTVIGFNTVRK